MMWAVQARALTRPGLGRTAPRNKLSAKTSPSYLRAPQTVTQRLARLSPSIRSYTSSNKGEKLAKDFESWVDSLPNPKEEVRLAFNVFREQALKVDDHTDQALF